MNSKQKTILIVGAFLVAAMVIYPPYEHNFQGVVVDAGYGPIFDLPRLRNKLPARLNVEILGAQVAGVLIICGLLSVAFRDPNKEVVND